jgi:autophagy-related protein 5
VFEYRKFNNALNIDDFDSFWKVNQRLIPVDDQAVRHIPLRLYLPDDCPVIQDRVSPRTEDGKISVRLYSFMAYTLLNTIGR